ncbi:TonB-dependent receptor [Altererythrobacter sp. GH1-8]|uniref:TonB-dependent receptor n=1 Tax=Altererythrobacter sp. GH1-8 TaxID=3349333 RepID=UPI00374D8CEA
MKSPTSLFFGTCLMALASAPLSAQAAEKPAAVPAMEDPPESIETPEGGAIIVRGQRLRGQLQVEQAPVLELDAADIEGIGANSLTELLAVISPQTGSSRGRGGGGQPAILVNGLRISSFRELRSYPPEAIAKVEVMPEEVAQRFGFPPDRRVVNLILKDNYNSREAEVEWEGPSDGGYAAREAEFTYLKFDQGNRLNFNAEVNDRTMLTEAERGVDQTEGSVSLVAGDPDPARYRSLVSDRLSAEATLNWTKANLDTGSLLTLNATYEREENRSLSGLNSVLLDNGVETEFRTFGAETPLRRRNNSDTFSTGLTYSRRLGGWQLTATSNGTATDSTSLIDQAFDTTDLETAALAGTLALDGDLPTSVSADVETATNRTLRSDNQVIFVGNPLMVPAGEVSTTFNFGFDWLQIKSTDTRTLQDTKLDRSRFEAGTNVAIPIADRGGAWGAIGGVTLNFSGGIEELSDFGTLTDASAGVTWEPLDGLTLSGTYILTQVAPSLTQLGSPAIETLNVPVFDLVNGETVLVAVTSGGNPNLRDEQQRDWKFAANWELPFWESTRFSVDYIRNRSDDVTSGFPALTQVIEDAFPDRVTRDAGGQLVELDQRFVTFAETRAERLVFGLTTRGSFGQPAPRPEPSGEAGPGGAPGQGESRQGENARPSGAGGPPGMGGRGFGADGRGRYFVNLTHTVELENTILIADGIAPLDQLDGDATGTFGFPRHSSRLEAGMFRRGTGMRLSGSYTGKTRVSGSDPAGASDLFFGDLVTFDVRVFFNLGEVFDAKDTFANNFRVSLRADNVFNARRNVRDGLGEVPTAFQPDLIDPTGRYLGLDLRKMF